MPVIEISTAITVIKYPFVFLTGTLPSPKETIKGNIKTVTEYKIDDDGKKMKVISDVICYFHVIKYRLVVCPTGNVF